MAELNNFSDAVRQLQKQASQMGISMTDAAAALREFASLAEEVVFVPGDAEHKYKTLNPTHEVL